MGSTLMSVTGAEFTLMSVRGEEFTGVCDVGVFFSLFRGLWQGQSLFGCLAKVFRIAEVKERNDL